MIYLHVPFCRSFCIYCSFYSELACKGKDAELFCSWADGVIAEMHSRREEIGATLDLNTLYIGGGTPSVLPLSVLEKVVCALEEFSGRGPESGRRYKEFTIEVNPEDIVEKGPGYVGGLVSLGVTRVSMGVQSLDDGILRWMNRRHDAAAAREAFRMLSGYADTDTGGLQFSVDLITGVPGMDMEILGRTLDEVISWRPDHISAYQLGVDEGSVLEEMISRGEVLELEEEECRKQYELVCARLKDAGYHHYEISNWALPGCEAVHNSAYWTRHPYVGLGPGAHSLLGERRSWNSHQLSGWTSSGETLSPEEIREERIMLGLRTDLGADVPEGDDGAQHAFRHVVIPESDWFVADDIIAGII